MAKVLLIDDDTDFVEINRVALESKGYEVIYAYDGEDGMDKALQESPDVVVLDVMMRTKTEGYYIARKMREHDRLKDTPIIMLTAVREKMDIPWKFEPDPTWLPITEFLEKPLPPTKLFDKIKEIMSKKF